MAAIHHPNHQFVNLNNKLSTKKEAFPYFNYNPSTGKICHTPYLDHESKEYGFFDFLAEHIRTTSEKQPCLTIEDLRDRVQLLKKILNNTETLKTTYVYERTGVGYSLYGAFSNSNEEMKENIIKSHTLFESAIKEVIAKTEALQDLTNTRDSTVQAMVELPDDCDEEDNLRTMLHYTALAFHHALKDEKWKAEHRDLLIEFYDWFHRMVSQEKISIKDNRFLQTYIVDAAEKLVDTLGSERVWTTFYPEVRLVDDQRTFKINALHIEEYHSLLEEFLDEGDYDQNDNAYSVVEKNYTILALVDQHLRTGSFKAFSENQTLLALTCPYFNTIPSFVKRSLNMINNSNTGIELRTNSDGLELTVNYIQESNQHYFENAYLSENTTHLTVRSFGKDRKKAHKSLNFLVDNLPNIQTVSIPFSQSTLQKSADKLKSLKHLQNVSLDFSNTPVDEVKNIVKINTSNFNNEGWKIYLINCDGFPKEIALEVIKAFPQSRSVSLKGVSDDELIYLSCQHPKLEMITINDSPKVTDDGIQKLAASKELLEEKKSSKNSENLRRLGLKGCINVSDKGLKPLLQKRGKKLLELDLGQCNVSDNLAKTIGERCRNLVYLSLWGCEEITDTGVLSFTNHCKKIAILDLTGSRITDKSLKAIAENLTRIETLNLDSCEGITRSGLEGLLSKCSHLKELYIPGTWLDVWDVDELKEKYPKVTIV